MHLRDFLALKPFHSNSIGSVCIFLSLHFTLSLQSAFYTQSTFYPWSAVCSPQSTFYTDRFCILSNGLDYPLEKKMSSVRTALAIRSKENCHPFERLRLSRRWKNQTRSQSRLKISRLNTHTEHFKTQQCALIEKKLSDP